MLKGFVALSVFFSISVSVYSQGKIEKVFSTLLNKKNFYMTENTFFCDSLYEDALSYDATEYFIIKKDRKAAKAIMKRGHVTFFDPKKIFTSLSPKQKVISNYIFKEMLPDTLILTACEKKAMNVYDSLENLAYRYLPDSMKTFESNALEDKIFEYFRKARKDKCYLSYRKKVELAAMWLIKFHLMYQYKNQYLVSYTYSRYGRVYNAFSEVIRIKAK
jgi:hypothetical protein